MTLTAGDTFVRAAGYPSQLFAHPRSDGLRLCPIRGRHRVTLLLYVHGTHARPGPPSPATAPPLKTRAVQIKRIGCADKEGLAGVIEI